MNINSLLGNKILDRLKLKASADNKMNIGHMKTSAYEGIENTVGKKRKCWLPAFSPFPTMFSKGLFLRVIINALPDNKDLHLYKLIEFADSKINIA